MTMERPQEEIEWYFERFTETIQKHQAIRADLSPMKIQYKVRTQKDPSQHFTEWGITYAEGS